jgi:hypothetical protein
MGLGAVLINTYIKRMDRVAGNGACTDHVGERIWTGGWVRGNEWNGFGRDRIKIFVEDVG